MNNTNSESIELLEAEINQSDELQLSALGFGWFLDLRNRWARIKHGNWDGKEHDINKS